MAKISEIGVKLPERRLESIDDDMLILAQRRLQVVQMWAKEISVLPG